MSNVDLVIDCSQIPQNSLSLSRWSYLLSLLGMFLAAFFVEALRQANVVAARRLVQQRKESPESSSIRLKARVLRAALHMAHVCLGYLVMLVVMGYNLGIFIAIVVGFGVGQFVWSDEFSDENIANKSDLEQVGLLNATACH